MQKIVGLWSVEGYNDSDLGYLYIDDLHTKIKIDNHLLLTKSCINGRAKGLFYRVYPGQIISGCGAAYRTLITDEKKDIDILKGKNIDSVTEVRLQIINMERWLNQECIKDYEVGAEYVEVNPILVCEDSIKKITIEYEAKWPKTNSNTENPIYFTLESKPVLKIRYKETKSIEEVEQEIVNLVRFFAILIGRIDGVNNVLFKTAESKRFYQLYNNADYTHLQDSNGYLDRDRTTYDELPIALEELYGNWLKFNEKYNLIIEYFFAMNGKKTLSVEDQYITWCRFLNGYYIRKHNQDYKATIILDKVKELIENSEFEEGLKDIFLEIDESYDRKRIAKAIAQSYLQKISFGDMVRSISEDNFFFIENNIKQVFGESESIRAKDVYKKINDTRNYYAHFKEDKTNCMSFKEIYFMNQVLYCLSVSVIFHELGIPNDRLENIFKKDDIIWHNNIWTKK